MSTYICLTNTHLLIIFCILVGTITWYLHNTKYNKIDNINYILKKKDYILDLKNKNDVIYNKKNYDVIYNPLIPPERKYPINIPTRGLPDNYQLIGLVLRNNTESAFNLFGRQLFPGSNQWEYFVQGHMNYTNIKIPIEIKGNKEIEDKQNIIIPGTNQNLGEYTVKLYNYDTPRYNPYN
jgi:hypothetical protein